MGRYVTILIIVFESAIKIMATVRIFDVMFSARSIQNTETHIPPPVETPCVPVRIAALQSCFPFVEAVVKHSLHNLTFSALFCRLAAVSTQLCSSVGIVVTLLVG
jgi:hypothetical protein